MSSNVTVNRKILKAIDSEIEDENVRKLAKDIIQFELANFGLKKPHFKDEFTKLIAKYSTGGES